MSAESITKFWSLIHSIIQEFWAIVEPQIEEAAIQNNVPIELYYYSEFGLESFSAAEFQQRDPFSNPLLFEKIFVTLNFKGWIEPGPDERYLVTDRARDAVRTIIQTGDSHLLPFESFTDIDLHKVVTYLKQIVLSNSIAPQPPEKCSIFRRFHVGDKDSPSIIQIREYLMDLFAYRDDSFISAAHPHFGRAGIVWSVLGALWNGDAANADQLATDLSVRGYEVNDYEVALQAAVQLGWVQETNIPGKFCITHKGRELWQQVEDLTNKYFYAPWSVLTADELDEFYVLLLRLRDQLNSFRKSK